MNAKYKCTKLMLMRKMPISGGRFGILAAVISVIFVGISGVARCETLPISSTTNMAPSANGGQHGMVSDLVEHGSNSQSNSKTLKCSNKSNSDKTKSENSADCQEVFPNDMNKSVPPDRPSAVPRGLIPANLLPPDKPIDNKSMLKR